MTQVTVERMERGPHRNKRVVRDPDEQQKYENLVRLIRHFGECAGQTDASVLKDLLSLHLLIDEAAAAAARALHEGAPGRPPLSWGVIASELGVTPQHVRQTWGLRRPDRRNRLWLPS